MASSPFVGEWNIDVWDPDPEPVTDGIPRDAFLVNSTLTITQTDDPDVNSFSLQWLDRNQQAASVSELHSDSSFPSPTLIGENLHVSFAKGDVRCDMVLSLRDENQKLDGTISVAGSQNLKDKVAPDTPSGTFTATANASGSNRQTS
jgi:hypothetical protein